MYDNVYKFKLHSLLLKYYDVRILNKSTLINTQPANVPSKKITSQMHIAYWLVIYFNMIKVT